MNPLILPETWNFSHWWVSDHIQLLHYKAHGAWLSQLLILILHPKGIRDEPILDLFGAANLPWEGGQERPQVCLGEAVWSRERRNRGTPQTPNTSAPSQPRDAASPSSAETTWGCPHHSLHWGWSGKINNIFFLKRQHGGAVFPISKAALHPRCLSAISVSAAGHPPHPISSSFTPFWLPAVNPLSRSPWVSRAPRLCAWHVETPTFPLLRVTTGILEYFHGRQIETNMQGGAEDSGSEKRKGTG